MSQLRQKTYHLPYARRAQNQLALFSKIYAILFVPLSLTTTLADATTITEPPRLWVAASDGVHQLRPENPTFDLHLPSTQHTEALAVASGTRQVWLRTNEGMHLFDAEGARQMGWDLPAKGPGKSHLAALPADGSVWVAEETSLEAFGIGGQAHHQKVFPEKIKAIALDAPRSTLWVLTASKVRGVHITTGEELIQFRPEVPGSLNALAVDPFTGDLWIGHGGGLLHYHPDGSLAVETATESGPPQVEHLITVADAQKLLGFWVASKSEVSFFDPERRRLFVAEPFGNTPQDRISGLTLDPATGSAWVTDGQRLAKVSQGSDNVVRYDLGEHNRVEALVVQRVERLPLPPTVEILRPISSQGFSTKRPEIELRFTPGDFAPVLETVEVSVGGDTLPIECTPQGENRLACELVDELPEGGVLLSASVADTEGHRSEAAVVHFQIQVEETSEEGSTGDEASPPEFPPTYTPVASPRGIRPNTPFVPGSDIDVVDTTSGNLTVRIPLGQRYSVGPLLSYQIQAVHNSNVWQSHEVLCEFIDCGAGDRPIMFSLTNPENNAGIGWEVHFGKLYAPIPVAGLGTDMIRWPNRDFGVSDGGRWMYVAPDGAVHYLYQLLNRGTGTGSRPLRYSKDGTYLRMQQTSDTHVKIEFPNGLVANFEKTNELAGTNFCGNGVNGCWRYASTEDPYGNRMEVNYSLSGNNETWTVSDSTGRSHELLFTRANNVRAGGDCQTNNFCTSEGDEWGDLRRVLTKVRVAAFAGQQATYNFITEPQRIHRGCPHDENGELPNGIETISVPVLTQIRIPGSQPYKFKTITNLGCRTGKLEELTLPTRGRYRYTYHHWSFPTRCSYRHAPDAEFEYNQWGIGRREFVSPSGSVQGTWNYTSYLLPALTDDNLSGPNCKRADYRITTVDGPVNGDGKYVRTKHYNAVHQGSRHPREDTPLSGWQVTDHGLPYSKDHQNSDADGVQFLSNVVFQCTDSSGGCIKKRSTYRRYTMEYKQCGPSISGDGAGCFKVNPHLEREKVIFHSDGNRWTKTWNQQPDGAGHFRRTVTRDNFSGVQTARTVNTTWTGTNVTLNISPTTGYVDEGDPTSYLPRRHQPWILGTYNRQSQHEPASGRTYTSLHQFNPQGTLRCTRRLKGPVPGPNDLVVELVRGTNVGTNAGLPIREIVAGGDTANLPTSGACAGSTGGASNGSRYRLFHEYQHYSLSRTSLSGFPNWYRANIDRNTGLPSATFNPQEQATTHNFDLQGRLISSSPEASLGAANLSISYVNPANAETHVVERQQHGGAVLTWKRSSYDAFGRLVQELRRRPTGSTTFAESKKIYRYDGAAGHLRRATTWQNSSGFNNNKATYYKNHDAFGRPQRIIQPDNQEQTITYFGERKVNSTVKVRTSTLAFSNVTSTTQKDSLGRVIKTTNPEHQTHFQYDPNGQQIRASRSQGGVTQVRLYGYDHRGFMVSERHPETGPNGNGTIHYTRDAFGQVRRQEYASRDLTYVYDNGGRLTKVKDTGAGGKLWKEWAWGSGNVGTNYRKGKVIQAKRHNYPLNNSTDWTVIENYEYRGALGQLSQKRTLVNFPHSNRSTPTFTLDLTYDALGHRKTIDYPKCSATACNGTGDLPAPHHVATTSYNQGMVTQVNSSRGFSGAYSYHPNFQLSQLTHSNGVTGTFLQGTNGINRPRKLTYKKGGTVLFSTGVYEYDGAGNIYAIGPDRYTYDKANRLTYGTVAQGGSRWESYVLDAFDNITAGQKESSTVIQFAVDETTNRYTGDFGDMEYDATGNLTQLGAPNWIMKWDAFDMQTQFTSVVTPESNHLYAYGPGDYRLVTLDTTTQEITYDFRDVDGAVLREYTLTGSGAPERWNNWKHEKDFVYGPEGLLGTVTRTGTRHFSHKDHLGTPRATSDLAGVRRGRHDYYPYGHEVARSGQVDEPTVKFTGHQRDAHGLSDYMLGRTCLWPLRRFASVDPARDGWNLYAYVRNNPILYIDPTGLVVTYSSTELQEFYEKAAAASEEVAAALEFFSGEIDLNISIGDAGEFKDGTKRDGIFSVSVLAEYDGNYEELEEATAQGKNPFYPATAEFVTGADFENNARIVLDSKSSDHDKLHELGHAAQRAFDPLQYIRDTARDVTSQFSTREHARKPGEKKANEFADRAVRLLKKNRRNRKRP